jgi:hypothetical protein
MYKRRVGKMKGVAYIYALGASVTDDTTKNKRPIINRKKNVFKLE